jgi:ABC-type transport system substrate-binding protein
MTKAKELVTQYRAETGRPLEITLLVANDTENITLGQRFAAGYEEAGMKVTLDPKPQINLLASVALGGFEISQFRAFAQPNPDADAHFYRASSIPPPDKPGVSLNFPRFADPRVDPLADEAIGSSDPAKRQAAYEQLNHIFAAQVPFVWLGQNTWVAAANTNVNGLYRASNGSIATVGPKTWIGELSVDR